jgi:hypothetical protein
VSTAFSAGAAALKTARLSDRRAVIQEAMYAAWSVAVRERCQGRPTKCSADFGNQFFAGVDMIGEALTEVAVEAMRRGVVDQLVEQDRYPLGTCLRREKTQLHGAALLGEGDTSSLRSVETKSRCANTSENRRQRTAASIT